MKCPYCDFDNKETSKYCENCGAELMRVGQSVPMSIEESGGQETEPETTDVNGSYESTHIDDNANYSTESGFVSQQSTYNSQSFMSQPSPQKKNSKLGIAVLVLGFLGMGTRLFGLTAIGLGIYDFVKNKNNKHVLTIIGLVLAAIGFLFSGSSRNRSTSNELAKTESVVESMADDEKEPVSKVESVSDAITGSVVEIESQQAESVVESQSESAAVVDAHTQTVYHVGDVLEDGNTRIVYVASGEYHEDNQFLQPQEGYHYIYMKLAFENTSKTSDAYVSIYNFECYADGYSCQAHYGADDDISSTLSAGRSTMGSIYYEVPDGAQEIQIEYEPNIFSNRKVTFAYDGNQDSGYQLEKNAQASENAVNPGQVIESKDMRINYISCETDTSYSEYFPPRDGHHFVTCTFEFENLSKSDISVSFYSFDCYADGVVCDASYFRDDGISATLSAGRKAVGTVTFEVPDDAAVVEVEYLTNFWTSNRVVFNALT